MDLLESGNLMDRYAEPFARALAVFVRELAKSESGESEGGGAVDFDYGLLEGNIEQNKDRQKDTEQQIAELVKHNDRLAAAGQLESLVLDEDTISKAVATRIRWVMNEQGVSQRQLAEQIGVSSSVISRVLRNPDRSRVKTMRRIAKALDIELREIL